MAAAQWQWLVSTVRPRQVQAPLSILDVGCGRGAFLKVAWDAGARVMGVELDPTAADACRAAGIPVVQASLFDAGPPPGPWNVITLWDVLDHLEDPAGALRLLVPALAPGGVLVVRGRNARFHVPLKVAYTRARRLAARMGLPDVSTVHRWGFTPDGYKTLLEHSGLDVVRLHPGLPTPGDRYGVLGPRLLSAFLKGAIRTAGTALHAASSRRLYPFPSVLVSAHRA